MTVAGSSDDIVLPIAQTGTSLKSKGSFEIHEHNLNQQRNLLSDYRKPVSAYSSRYATDLELSSCQNKFSYSSARAELGLGYNCTSSYSRHEARRSYDKLADKWVPEKRTWEPLMMVGGPVCKVFAHLQVDDSADMKITTARELGPLRMVNGSICPVFEHIAESSPKNKSSWCGLQIL